MKLLVLLHSEFFFTVETVQNDLMHCDVILKYFEQKFGWK